MSKQSEPKQALNQHSHIYKESCIICGCSKGNISKDGRVAMSVFFLSTANSKKQKKNIMLVWAVTFHLWCSAAS